MNLLHMPPGWHRFFKYICMSTVRETTFIALIISVLLIACSTPGPGLFARRSPHEQYGQRLADAGLRESALGRRWFGAADKSLDAPLTVTLPYKETGYFAAELPSAMGVRFGVRKGEKLSIVLEKKPVTGFAVFYDLWELPTATADNKPKLVTAGDTTGKPLELDIKDDGNYILRLQPELLKSGEYTLTITTGPSLAFPLPASAKPTIGSFWGAGRDGGARKHEGIDIFAPKRSPAIACADGVVTGVNENNLGGKVVFMRPEGKNYVLYYAHLDSQLVSTGQTVRTGDVLGLTGNTGNARFTPSHLHFGIYTAGGATDPLPFINPVKKEPAKISASLANLGKLVRSGSRSKLYGEPAGNNPPATLSGDALLRIEAAAANWYKVALPDGQTGFISSAEVKGLNTPLKRAAMRMPLALLDEPDTMAVRKGMLPTGSRVDVLASYKDFYFVSSSDTLNGWITKQEL